jgi:hypothetical protein
MLALKYRRQAPSVKIFGFSEYPNHRYIISHPVPLRGALRNVNSAGRVAVAAEGAFDWGA